MPPVKLKSPTLVGGISQQPPHLRFASQVESAINVSFDVATGAAKRPGTELVAVISDLSTSGNYNTYSFERGDAEKYIAIIGDGGSGASILRIFQDDGREATVTITADAQTYLNAGGPIGKDFRFAANNEYIMVLNRKAVGSITSGAPSDTTLPIKITRSTAPTSAAVAEFDVEVNVWTHRDGTSGGDDTSNPGLEVIISGDGMFSDIEFYRNRLVLVGESYIAFSQAGEFLNFYIQDVADIVDDDPLSTRLDSSIESIISFRQALVVFTRGGQQYESNTPDLLTPTTLSFDKTTRYETQDVEPIALGSTLYFVGDKNDGSILFEYIYDDTQVSSVASDVTRHVDRLLPDQIRSTAGSSGNTTVFLLPDNQPAQGLLLQETGDKLLQEDNSDLILDKSTVGSNKLFVYRYYWQGQQKQQSAFSIYQYGDDDLITDVCVQDNYAYMLTLIGGSSGVFVLERQPLGIERTPKDGMPAPVHLDRCSMIAGSYDGSDTSWTLQNAAIEANKVVLGPSFGAIAGTEIDVTASGSDVVFDGQDYSNGESYVGQSFRYELQPTRMYRRDRNGDADVLGELQINKVGMHHFDTLQYNLEATLPRRTTRSKLFSVASVQTGTNEAYFGGDADDLLIMATSETSKPTTITAYEIEANYHPRA